MAKQTIHQDEHNNEVQAVSVLALRNCSYGKQRFYMFKHYDIAEDVALKLAKTKNVKILRQI